MRSQDSRASKTPGHNGILVINCNRLSIVDPEISDSGEHAFRVGGSSAYPGGCDELTVGVITARRSGGCAFKSNPNTGTYLKNSVISGVVGIDVGRGSSDGNCEVVRLAKYDGLMIGFIRARSPSYSFSCTTAVTISSGIGLEIGTVDAPLCRNRIVRLVDDQDESTENISGIEIGPIIGSVSSARAAVEFLYQDLVNARTIGNVKFKLGNVSGFTNLLMEVTGTVTNTGPVEISGTVSGSVVPNITCPANNDWQASILWSGWRYSGQAANGIYGYQYAVHGDQLPTGNNPVSTYLARSSGTAALGAIGGSYGFGRVGSTRRGAALAIQQTGSSAFQNGVGLYGQSSGSTANESLILLLLAKHNGAIFTPLLPTYASNAAAITGGLVAGDQYKTSTGELRIVV